MTRINKKILYPDLCYKLTGLFFKTHSKLGRFCREKQYSDELERLFKDHSINYKREFELQNLMPEEFIKGNKIDFLINNDVLVEIKAKKFVTKEDYYQMMRYLESGNLELGLIVNFRNSYLKPKRILNSKFYSDNSDANSGYSGRLL